MDIRFSTFLVFVALLRKELRATIAVGPSNTVASIGEQIRLNCTANMVIGYWYLSKNGVLADEVQITQIACLGVIPGFTDHYAVESLGGGYTCNLIVANITMAQAGVYRCQEATNQALSILTVTDPKPAITDNSTTIAVEKENIVIDCVLNYNGSSASNPTLQPYFYWTNSTGQRVTNFNDSTTYDMAFSQLAVTAGRQNIAAYTCHIYLILNPPTTPFYASNTPTVNSGATSRTIEVHYYPAITSLTSTVSITDNCVYKEETLSCSADANPQAQYEWLDLSNDVVTPGATKAISAGGRYQCRAFNDIRSQIHNDTKITNLTTCVSPTNVTISGLGCVKNSCTCMNHTLERLMLTCMANGYPEPTYQWQSDVNYEQKPGYIEVTTDGNYSCTASNKYGSETYNDTASITVSDCKPQPTTTPSTPATKTVPRSTGSISPSIAQTTPSGSNPGPKPVPDPFPPGAVVGIVIGCLVIVNVIAIGLFIRYYGKVPESDTSARSESANSKSNKNRLNGRFPWLQKMLPCLNDTKEETGSNISWVLLFAFLGTVTGFVTFPAWICLANKSEKTNERSALTTRENGGAEGESASNGMRQMNYPPPDYPPDAPPFQNRKRGQQQDDPYQNSSTVNIELVISHHSQNRMTDSPKPKTSAGLKPTPPDRKGPSGPAKKYVKPDPVITDPGQSPLYADLPAMFNQNPLKPEQLLVDPEITNAPEPENNYAPLNII